jgi:hypothetical protein
LCGRFTAEFAKSPYEVLSKTGFGVRGIALGVDSPPGDFINSELSTQLGWSLGNMIQGSLTRNNLFLLFGRRDDRELMLHCGGDARANAGVERHVSGSRLAYSLLNNKVRFSIARKYFANEVNRVNVLVRETLPGAPISAQTSGSETIWKALNCGLDAASEIAAATTDPRFQPEQVFLQDSCDVLIRSIPPEYHRVTNELVNDARKWSATRGIPAILTHGDFWLNNILFEGTDGELDALRLTGVIDWEWARQDGAPLYDVMHLAAMTFLEMEKVPLGQVLNLFLNLHTAPEWFQKYIRDAVRRFGLMMSDVPEVGKLMILRHIWQSYCLTYSGGEAWLTKLLREISD